MPHMQELLPHRPYGDICTWKNANMMKKKTSEALKKQLKPLPPQQPNALKTQLSANTLASALRPSLQRRPSQPKPSLQLLPSDDLLEDDLMHEAAPKSLGKLAQQIKAMQAPSAAQQQPLGTSRAAAGKAQRTAGIAPPLDSLPAVKETGRAAGVPFKGSLQQEPQEHSAAVPVNASLQQEARQPSRGMLLSTREEPLLSTDVPAASQRSQIGSMDGADPLFEQYDEMLREELHQQAAAAEPDHSPQPEGLTVSERSTQQALLAKAAIQQPGNISAEPESARRIVSDAPQQTLLEPVPGLRAQSATPAPALLVSFCCHPCQIGTFAELSASAGSVAAATLCPFCRCKCATGA